MRSMTGFGAGTYSNESLSVTIEMRAVNQRFLELNIRLPHRYLFLEDDLRQVIKTVLHRGKVDVYVTVRETAQQAPQIYIDFAYLSACKKALDEVQTSLFHNEKTTLSQIIGLSKDWFIQEAPPVDADAVRPVFLNAAEEALQDLRLMRECEGANIRSDLIARTEKMKEITQDVDVRKDLIIQQYTERLQKKITAIFDMAHELPDESRVLQEVAIYADKADITEEIVRFQSHIVQLTELLTQDGDVGRKLDFLVQEMNREVNTIGSKANDRDITESVLQLKNEIEKIREQIQNIE